MRPPETLNADTEVSATHSTASESGRLRVLHVYKTFYPDTTGGVEVVLSQLMRNLSSMGIESRLFVLSSEPTPSPAEMFGAQIFRLQTSVSLSSNPMSLRALLAFRKHVHWADIIHYQFPWPFADLLHLMHGTARPSLVSYQSDIVRQKHLMRLYRPLMDRFLGSVDRICATSASYSQTSPVLPRFKSKVKVIPNGLDQITLPHAPVSLRERWRSQLGQGFFLFVGVLRYYKGLHTLISAAQFVSGRIVIAGTGSDELNLKSQAAALGIQNVSFVGHVTDEDKAALLELCGVFVFPSHLRSEAFGMSLVEASMFSRPMISCEIGTGTSFVNLHGVTGLTVPPENPQALASAMCNLYQNDDLRKKMACAARQRYEALFTGERMASAYLAQYQELMAL